MTENLLEAYMGDYRYMGKNNLLSKRWSISAQTINGVKLSEILFKCKFTKIMIQKNYWVFVGDCRKGTSRQRVKLDDGKWYELVFSSYDVAAHVTRVWYSKGCENGLCTVEEITANTFLLSVEDADGMAKKKEADEKEIELQAKEWLERLMAVRVEASSQNEAIYKTLDCFSELEKLPIELQDKINKRLVGVVYVEMRWVGRQKWFFHRQQVREDVEELIGFLKESRKSFLDKFEEWHSCKYGGYPGIWGGFETLREINKNPELLGRLHGTSTDDTGMK